MKVIFGIYESICLIKAIYLWAIWKSLPPKLPWFYTQPWGEAQLAPKSFWIFLLLAEAVVGLLVFLWTNKKSDMDEKTKLTISGGVFMALFIEVLSFIKVVSIFR